MPLHFTPIHIPHGYLFCLLLRSPFVAFVSSLCIPLTSCTGLLSILFVFHLIHSRVYIKTLTPVCVQAPPMDIVTGDGPPPPPGPPGAPPPPGPPGISHIYMSPASKSISSTQ